MVSARDWQLPSGARELSSGAGSMSCPDAAVLAAERGEEEAVLAWLEGGGRVNATYERGEVSGLTLLIGAARYGHERLVDLLLRHGAAMNQKDNKGWTALTSAAARTCENIARISLCAPSITTWPLHTHASSAHTHNLAAHRRVLTPPPGTWVKNCVGVTKRVRERFM